MDEGPVKKRRPTREQMVDRTGYGISLLIVAGIVGLIVEWTPGGLDFSGGFTWAAVCTVALTTIAAALRERR